MSTEYQPKTLQNMPHEVRMTAWINRKDFSPWAKFVCEVEHRLGVASVCLSWLAWVVVAFWLLAFYVSALGERYASIRTFSGAALVVTFALLILTHWLGIQTNLPRPRKGYPALGDSMITEYFKTLAVPTLIYSVLLAVSGVRGTHASTGSSEHWAWTVGLALVGCTALWLYYSPFKYGYVVPTEGEELAVNQSRSSQGLVAARASEGKETSDYATPISLRPATKTFSNIYGMQPVKDKLLEPASMILASRGEEESPPNGILLHGEPGNGKTIFAEALAGELNVPFLEMTYGDVSSKWVGELPRVISNCFALAKRSAPCVFFVDEFDSFIQSRDNPSNNSEDLKVTNTLLTEIVSLRKHQVVLVAATNYLKNLDPAAVREGRFDFKVEITNPDEEARVGLLSHEAKRFAPMLTFNEEELVSVAKRWNGFSVSRLVGVAKALPRYAREHQRTEIGFDDWMGALRTVQGRVGKVDPRTRSLNQLVLGPDVREALEMISARLRDVVNIESKGGTLPTGALFYGPPGTGKTAAAKALAKEAGWSFISTSGPELVADRKKLDAVYREAKDLRPAIIFIDEADDLLRNRRMSATPDLTNKLLVLMDGAEERVSDVVFLAATNNFDDIDPALLRAPRFTEKVLFEAPTNDAIPRYVGEWCKRKKVTLDPSLDVFDISTLLEGQTIANIDGVLQYALNRAIHRLGSTPGVALLTSEDVSVSLSLVSTEN